MTYIRLSYEVRASAQDLFDIADDHDNYSRFFEGFRNLSWSTPRHQVGSRLKMEGRLGGTILPVEIKTTEVVPGKRISGVFTAGLDGRINWEFDASEDTTWITLSAEYKLPRAGPASVPDRAVLDRELCVSLQRTLAAMKDLGENRGSMAA